MAPLVVSDGPRSAYVLFMDTEERNISLIDAPNISAGFDADFGENLNFSVTPRLSSGELPEMMSVYTASTGSAGCVRSFWVNRSADTVIKIEARTFHNLTCGMLCCGDDCSPGDGRIAYDEASDCFQLSDAHSSSVHIDFRQLGCSQLIGDPRPALHDDGPYQRRPQRQDAAARAVRFLWRR